MSGVVLDASALLALLFDEPGADEVEAEIGNRCRVSAVNWSEVLAKLAEKGVGRRRAEADSLAARLESVVEVVDFAVEDAELAAALVPRTRPLGLSLADRACLALGLRCGLPVLTADRAWSEVEVDLEVRTIR